MFNPKFGAILLIAIWCAIYLSPCVSAEDSQTIEAQSQTPLPKMKLRSGDIYYPDKAKRVGAQGRVLLEFGIDDSGRATQISVEKLDGDKILSEAAVAMVKGASFDLSSVPKSAEQDRHEYRLSFIFEMTPCGKLQHFDVPRDSRIALCGTPIRPR